MRAVQLVQNLLQKPKKSTLVAVKKRWVRPKRFPAKKSKGAFMRRCESFLVKEKQVLASQGKGAGEATVIVRAHKDAQTGRVQELIQKCQENDFEKFALRAKEDVGNN